MPDIDDNAGDIFAERFGAAWNNGDETESIKEAASVPDVNLKPDKDGMTVVRLNQGSDQFAWF